MNTNTKDSITNICGVLIAIAGIVPTLKSAGVDVPEVVIQISTTLGVIAGAVVAYFTGKNHDGSTKQSPTKS